MHDEATRAGAPEAYLAYVEDAARPQATKSGTKYPVGVHERPAQISLEGKVRKSFLPTFPSSKYI